MKSIITAILLAFTATFAYADEKIDIINANKIGGMNHRTAEYISTNLSDLFAAPTNVANCAAAVNILKNTNNPTIAIWDAVGNATAKDQVCNIMDETNFVMVYAQSYYHFCRLSDASQNNVDALIGSNKKVGVSNLALTKTQLSETLKGLNSNATVVPYPTAADAAAALAIGEIDYVYTGRVTENMICVLTNDPNSTDIPTVNSYFDNPFAYSGNKIIVIGANIDLEQVKEQLQTTFANEDWIATFNGYNYDMSTMDRLDQYDLIVEEIASIKFAQQ